jgi:hypothetical protein
MKFMRAHTTDLQQSICARKTLIYDFNYNHGGFGSLVKYPALVLHYSGGLLRFCA